MTEKFDVASPHTPESAEDPKYVAFQAAFNEEQRLLKEIDDLLTSAPDRAKAEQDVLDKYADHMESAMNKSRQALDEWLQAVREAGE